ncbi:iron chaperone [Leucobacter albus]|uniref:Iron chaperone n=1 Tax=Leucobacter albus TaxID=272210 RepID=A0ABW3TM15_9MICO
MAEKAKTVEEYLARLDPSYRAELERIRALVKELVPGLEETVSYGMPTLKHRGRALVYFTASKKHLSFYPSSWAIAELRERLSGYKTTEHAIQFTPETALATDLIEDLVRVHVREIEADRQ